MARYAANNLLGGTQQALTSTFKTILAMFATTGALRRGELYDLVVGTDGTPADGVLTWSVDRMTADGTATGVTPLPLDPADVAALTSCKANYTAEPTVTANSSQNVIPENQRATYRWCAFPGGEIIWPAVANNGLVIRAKSPGYTGTCVAHAFINER